MDEQEIWIAVATASEVSKVGMLDVRVGRQAVLLVARENEVLAFQGLCPHQHARLSDGMLVEGALQCPRHLARFNLSDGSCGGGWQLPPLRRYAVRIEEDNVLLSNPLVRLD